jgi:hypothetical protein
MGEVVNLLSAVQNGGGMLAVLVYFLLEVRYLRRDLDKHILSHN